jgi:hypothetical protein
VVQSFLKFSRPFDMQSDAPFTYFAGGESLDKQFSVGQKLKQGAKDQGVLLHRAIIREEVPQVLETQVLPVVDLQPPHVVHELLRSYPQPVLPDYLTDQTHDPVVIVDSPEEISEDV